jgi:hypothetical protein
MVKNYEDHMGENCLEVPPPPPPQALDLATVLDRQNHILELLANTVVTQNNNGNGQRALLHTSVVL